MKNFLKKYFGVVLIGVVLFSFFEDVDAVTYTYDNNNTNVCFNRITGGYGGNYIKGTGSCPSGYGVDAVKLIDGKYAYCIEWSLKICSKNYEVDPSWNKYSKQAIFAGMLMDHMEAHMDVMKVDAYQKYQQVGAIMNAYFYRDIGSAASYNFYPNNLTIRNVYSTMMPYVNALQLSSTIPSPNFSVSSNLMNKVGDYYVSNKIDLSGLYSTYGGKFPYGGAPVTYVLKAMAAGGKAEICTDALGENCVESMKINPKSNDEKYNFYVKVVAGGNTTVTSGSLVTVNISVSNSSSYPTVVRYYNTDCSNSQHLVTKDYVTINRNGGISINLRIPDETNHRISVQKVDEHGQILEGASLAIYKDDVSVPSNLLVKNEDGFSEVSYVSPKVSVGEDDFFNHSYYLVENRAPDGYVLPSMVTKIYDKEIGTSSGTTCYFNDGVESNVNQVTTDAERCNFENYIYMCRPSNGSELIEAKEDNTCPEPLVIEDDANSGTNEDNLEGRTGGSGEGDMEDEDVVSVVTYEKVCYSKKDKKVIDDITYCTDKANYIKVEQVNGNFVVIQPNSKNIIRISKQDISGKEISGATLKICTEVDYEAKRNECTPAKTVNDIEMTWVSTSQIHEIAGVKKGNYYIVEVTPPRGYISATIATAFSIDELGNVKTRGKTITNDQFKNGNVIVIENDLSSITISKQDMATSKELPGATLSICRAYLDSNGEWQLLTDQYDNECIPAVLSNGEEAVWVSTNKPKKIEGLGVGTYYLVEKIAPTDYSTAESILFTLKADGTLVDKDGNSLAEQKLVMKDQLIQNVKTGEFSKYLIIIILTISFVLGIGSYYYLKVNQTNGSSTNVSLRENKKIRGRSIHKYKI